MRKSRKFAAVCMAAILAIGSLAGCGSKEQGTTTNTTPTTATTGGTSTTGPEKVNLKVWAPQNQIDPGTIDSMCKSFQELHPEWDITFTVEAQGEDNCKDSVLKDVSAAADVYFFASDQLQELVNAGAIAQLGGTTEKMVKDTIAESVVATVTAEDGGIYAIPFTHNTFFMYYDKTLLNENDIKSMEGIMAKALADNAYNFSFDSAGGWKLGAWYYGAGLTVYGESQHDYAAGCNWNNATGVAVTNYLIDLLNNPKCAYNDDISVTELIAEHRLGAWFDGAWNLPNYSKALGDDLGMAKLPTFNPDGNDYQLKGFYSSKAIGVNPQSAHPQVAVAFAAYLGSEEMQLKRFQETNQVPANLAAGNNPEVQSSEIAKVTVEEANVASVKQPNNAEFSSRYWTYAGAIATEIRSGVLNKNNVQEKLNTFCDALKVE